MPAAKKGFASRSLAFASYLLVFVGVTQIGWWGHVAYVHFARQWTEATAKITDLHLSTLAMSQKETIDSQNKTISELNASIAQQRKDFREFQANSSSALSGLRTGLADLKTKLDAAQNIPLETDWRISALGTMGLLRDVAVCIHDIESISMPSEEAMKRMVQDPYSILTKPTDVNTFPNSVTKLTQLLKDYHGFLTAISPALASVAQRLRHSVGDFGSTMRGAGLIVDVNRFNKQYAVLKKYPFIGVNEDTGDWLTFIPTSQDMDSPFTKWESTSEYKEWEKKVPAFTKEHQEFVRILDEIESNMTLDQMKAANQKLDEINRELRKEPKKSLFGK